MASTKLILQRETAEIESALPHNVYLVRQKSGWNDIDRLCRVIKLLGDILAPYAEDYQPTLTMDACKVHLHQRIAAACNRAGIWLIIIPARLTWLLQPCDTHAFLKYKRILRERFQEKRSNTPNGRLATLQIIQVVCEAIRKALQGAYWALAFQQDGFSHQQTQVSRFILQQLQMQTLPPISHELPTKEILELIFPRRCRIPQRTLFAPFHQAPPEALPPHTPPPEQAVAISPRAGRLRSSSAHRAETESFLLKHLRAPAETHHRTLRAP